MTWANALFKPRSVAGNSSQMSCTQFGRNAELLFGEETNDLV